MVDEGVVHPRRGRGTLGAPLVAATSDSCRVLHDRRIPRMRANIDHLAVTPSWVYGTLRADGLRDAREIERVTHLLAADVPPA